MKNAICRFTPPFLFGCCLAGTLLNIVYGNFIVATWAAIGLAGWAQVVFK